MIDHLDYLRGCLQLANFNPYQWDGEDRNIGAFRSKNDLIEWYCQPPGIDGEPYRDRGFYTRELAMLSIKVAPKVVVEFGTSLGIGTCLLRWLNPNAQLTTVDIKTEMFMPGNQCVPIGHLAKHQNIECEYICGESWNYQRSNVDLCFIDADHSYDAVVKDSERAWQNRNTLGTWTIIWHDYNTRHPGVMLAVNRFCHNKLLFLFARSDSDTVWVTGVN